MPVFLSDPPASMTPPQSTVGDRTFAAAARIGKLWPQTPKVGLILGSGLAGLRRAIEEEVCLPYRDLPGFVQPTAVGHDGELVCGRLSGVPVVACAGRAHGYEGHDDAQLRFPVRLFDTLGVKTVVLSNAAGGVNPTFRVGDVMLVGDHLDLIGRPTLKSLCGTRPPTPAADCYCRDLARTATSIAQSLGRPVKRGTYAALTGPNYETRAEYRMLRQLRVDAVGMSTAPEADEAHRRKLPVIAFSTITNECDPDALAATTGEAVVDAAAAAEPFLRQLVEELLASRHA